jgi:hypothetical protein
MKQYKETDYYITETGEVWSMKYGDLRKLKPNKRKDGYLMIWLQIDGKQIGKKIHRLVGETFIPNPRNYPQINHIDGNKLNNNLSNLEWCTGSYNRKHAHQMGLNKLPDNKGEKHSNCKLTNEQVLEIRELYSTGNYSQIELSKKFQVFDSAINMIIKRKRWKHI